MSEQNTQVVLVPGAWADGSSWSKVIDLLRKEGIGAVSAPIRCITVPVGRPLWKDIPTWYLLAEQDRMIVEKTQHFMADRMGARVRALPVDHAPSVTAPDAVVALIIEALRSVSH